MSWLDVFTTAQEIRPARPANENHAGRKIDLGTVGTSSTSSTSSNKTCNGNPNQEQETPSKVSVVDLPTPGGNLPTWVRANIPGEVLDDSRERVCASPRCEAVFMRQAGQSDESWSNKRFCSGQCFSGQPSIPLKAVKAVEVAAMKLLDLFATGTNGTSGTALQSQGNIPSRSGPGKTGQRDQMPDDDMPISVSGPGGPGPDFTNGTGKNTGTVSPSRWSRSSRSENCVGKTLPESTTADPTPEQIAHAHRMLVVCPDMPKGCTVHCWYCSRCKKARTCTAWCHLRSHVEFFRQSTIPYSALVTEATEGRGIIQ